MAPNLPHCSRCGIPDPVRPRHRPATVALQTVPLPVHFIRKSTRPIQPDGPPSACATTVHPSPWPTCSAPRRSRCCGWVCCYVDRCCANPPLGDAVVIEPDEMWHFPQHKDDWIWKALRPRHRTAYRLGVRRPRRADLPAAVRAPRAPENASVLLRQLMSSRREKARLEDMKSGPQ
jgi:hypothetical protein